MQDFLIILAALIIIFGLMMISLKLGKYNERTSGCCGGGQCATHITPDTAEDGCCGKHEH